MRLFLIVRQRLPGLPVTSGQAIYGLTDMGVRVVGNAKESSRSLQRISLVETVGNVTGVP